jgi:hypothetical protein
MALGMQLKEINERDKKCVANRAAFSISPSVERMYSISVAFFFSHVSLPTAYPVRRKLLQTLKSVRYLYNLLQHNKVHLLVAE